MNTNFEQLGGFKTIDFFILDDTVNWVTVVNSETLTQTDFPVSTINDFGIIAEDSIYVNVVPKESAEGTVYIIDISFNFINRNEIVENYLDSYLNKPIVAILENRNKIKKLFGTNEESLFLTYKIDDGKKAEDSGMILVNIKGETRTKPIFYSA